MIDSAEKFTVVFEETLSPPVTGFRLFHDFFGAESARPDTGLNRKDSSPLRRRNTSGTASAAKGGKIKIADQEPVYDPGTIELHGTVRHIGLEGGFWGITGDNGQNYEPVNMPDELKQTGMKVKVWFRVRKDIGTTRMWGIPVQIVRYVVPRSVRH